MVNLTSVDVSYNELSNPEDASRNNQGVCGNNSKGGLKPCNFSAVVRRKESNEKLVVIILVSLFGSLFVLVLLFAVLFLCRKKYV